MIRMWIVSCSFYKKRQLFESEQLSLEAKLKLQFKSFS